MASPKEKSEPKPLSQTSVLVVDDSKFVTDIVTSMLRRVPVGKIMVAPSAEDAFYNLEKENDLADIMLLDYGLRGMDGQRFLEKLRTHKKEKLRKLPVVIITGHNDMTLFEDMAKLGIAAFIVKPVSAAALLAALERALQGYRVPKPRITADSLSSNGPRGFEGLQTGRPAKSPDRAPPPAMAPDAPAETDHRPGPGEEPIDVVA